MKGITTMMRDFILNNPHPCIMAKTAFRMNDVKIATYSRMNSMASAKFLFRDIKEYIANYDYDTNKFESFIAVFPYDSFETENDFEHGLWALLTNINLVDNYYWDESVSSNPSDPDFSFSIAGKAFYVVGMHPLSSRIARRSPYPALALNMHLQFEKLRDMGIYENIRDRIRARDKEIQGTINPMLTDFGTQSEASQYSGRNHESTWECPFSPKKI